MKNVKSVYKYILILVDKNKKLTNVSFFFYHVVKTQSSICQGYIYIYIYIYINPT